MDKDFILFLDPPPRTRFGLKAALSLGRGKHPMNGSFLAFANAALNLLMAFAGASSINEQLSTEPFEPKMLVGVALLILFSTLAALNFRAFLGTRI